MAFYKTKRSRRSEFTAGFIIITLFIAAGSTLHVRLENSTNDKPVEQYLVDGVTGKNELEVKFEQTKKENEFLKLENRQLKTPATSRGEETEYLKERVIAAIDNNLGGILAGKGNTFYDAGKDRHVNPMLMAAIAKHETANGTSKVLRQCNNIAGINWTGEKGIPHQGRYRVFKSVEDGIYNLAYILDNHYIRQNRVSIETIGAKSSQY